VLAGPAAPLGGSHRRCRLLKVLETELQLIRGELLRAATEPAALELLDQRMELLDLGVLGRQSGGKLAHHLLQKCRVGR